MIPVVLNWACYRDLDKLKDLQQQKKKEQESKIKQDAEEFQKIVEEADKRAKARNKKMVELREEIRAKELEAMAGLGEKQREQILEQHKKNMASV